MSDNSNLANSNIEPSMEDILSSIRKVIAEDLINAETASEEVAPEEAVSEELAPSEEIAEVAAEDITESIVEAPISSETTSEEITFSEDNASTDEFLTFDPLAAGDIEADVENTDIDDILELDSIITELPDPLALTDEMGEAMELVTLEEDPIDDAPGTHEDTKNVDLEKFFADDEPADDGANTNAADEMSEMDIIMAANASTLAKAGISDLADTGNDMDFDETLDLVMDSDASDYVTTKVTAKQSGEMEIENWRDRATDKVASDKIASGKVDFGKPDVGEAGTDILGLSLEADAELQASVDEAVQKALTETLAEETLIEEAPIQETMPEEPDEQVVFEPELLQEDLAELDLLSDIDNLDPEPAAVTPDEDMDLVKSLLDDLMDEPAPETQVLLEDETMSEAAHETLETDTDITDFTNEILFREEPDHSLDEQDLLIPEPPTGSEEIDLAAFEQALIDPKPEAQSTLAQIAADVGGSENISAGTPNPDDIVTLEDPGLISKLALAGSVAAGAAVLATTDETPEAEMPEAPETQSVETPQISTKEDETMATPLKTETQDDVGNAFASLTSAVQEKAMTEENGPPIGELVKEALKPMLQEWLDNNLKAMVQRAVTKEIKRISSGK